MPDTTPDTGAHTGPAKWTVMIYMAAHVNAELDAHAVRDLQEMERAEIDPGVRVVVQINRHWPTRPQRYEIRKHRSALVNVKISEAPADSSTGSKAALISFLSWAVATDIKKSGLDEERRYMLVLWGHSFGLGFGRNHGDPLILTELQEAVDAFKTLRPGGAPLDILGANACAISYAEAAFQLRESARFLLASQIAVPFAGWPFETVLTAIKPGIEAEVVGRLVVDRYVSTFRASRRDEVVAMSLLDLKEIRDFKTRFVALAKALDDVVQAADPGASDRLAHVRACFLSTSVGEVRPLIDLKDLCENLRALASDLDVLQPGAPGVADLATATKSLKDMLDATFTVVSGRQRIQEVAGPRFVVFTKQTGEPRGLNGLGVFAPFVTDPADLERLGIGQNDQPAGRSTYKDLALIQNSGWDTLVYDTLRAGLPSEVVDGIESSRATSQADRAAVTQMLVAVDSLFDVLDRRIEAARLSVEDALEATTVHSAVGTLLSADPFLELQLLDHKQVRKSHGKAQKRLGSTALGDTPDKVTAAIRRLDALEKTVGSLERAIRRTLTNGTFGLGPGPGGSLVFQPATHGKGGGAHGFDDKGGGAHGAPDDKGGGAHGAPDDKGGGAHGPTPLVARAGMPSGLVAVSAPAAVAALFADVGDALANLEAAIGSAETLVALAASAGGVVINGGAPNRQQVYREMRIIVDVATEARRTLRRVLADPIYGFGPGEDGLTVEDRAELSRAGGLCSMRLKLM